MTTHSFETTVRVRYQDLDAMGHVNNAVYATYLEEARIEYLTDGLGIDQDELSTVLAHLELDFEAPLVSTREATVGLSVTDVGTKSFTLDYEIRDDSDTVARAETVQVWVDRETGTAAPLPDAVRDLLADNTTIES